MTSHGDLKTHCAQISCSTCSISRLCFPAELDSADTKRFETIVRHGRPLRRGQYLHRPSDPFRSIFIVRSGSLKTMSVDTDGEERVLGFLLPGDRAGLDAVGNPSHPTGAAALEMSAFCEVPFDELMAMANRIPGLWHGLLRILSAEIDAEHEQHQWFAKRTAEERVALLLLGFSERFARLGLSRTRFMLSMSRGALSNYLGLAPETMSRLFKRFRAEGWVTTDGREVLIRDMDALRSMARGEVPASPRAVSA